MEALELFSRRANQHVAHEEGVVGAGAHDAHADTVALIPAGESVNDIDAVPGVEVVDGTLTVDAPDLQWRSLANRNHGSWMETGGEAECT